MAAMQSAMRETMAGAARSSELEGLALLREDPWRSGSNFTAAVRGFADGMASGTDWRALRAQMTVVIEERKRAKTGDAADIEKTAKHEQVYIDQALALRWARDDIGAAVDWYMNEVMPPDQTPDQSAEGRQRMVGLLHKLPPEHRPRVLDWFEQHRAHEQWDDTVVVEYARRIVANKPDVHIERLVAMPDEEANREAIVTMFVQPKKKGGQMVLRHEPKELLRLMDAANLSPESKARLKGLMVTTGWSEDQLGEMGG